MHKNGDNKAFEEDVLIDGVADRENKRKARIGRFTCQILFLGLFFVIGMFIGVIVKELYDRNNRLLAIAGDFNNVEHNILRDNKEFFDEVLSEEMSRDAFIVSNSSTINNSKIFLENIIGTCTVYIRNIAEHLANLEYRKVCVGRMNNGYGFEEVISEAAFNNTVDRLENGPYFERYGNTSSLLLFTNSVLLKFSRDHHGLAD